MPKDPKSVRGTGRSFEEALRNAIAAANRLITQPEGVVTWTIQSMGGRTGGFTGSTTFSVELRITD